MWIVLLDIIQMTSSLYQSLLVSKRRPCSRSLKVAHIHHVLGGGSRDALPLLLLLELLLRVQVSPTHTMISTTVLLLVLLLVSDRQILEGGIAW